MSATESENKKTKYSSIVAAVFDDGNYFDDAKEWYYLKYLAAFSERTFFIVISAMSVTIILLLYLTINNILPLKESFPVVVRQPDAVKYYPTIEAVKPEKLDYNSNEAILRLLLIRFVRELFSHSYKTGKIEDLNTKLLKIKNYSTDEVLQKFRSDFNQIINQMFNKNVEQTVRIKTFRFKEKENVRKSKFSSNFLGKLIFKTKVFSEAELEYDINTILPGERRASSHRISLDFKFDAIKYNGLRREFSKPALIITNYTVSSVTNGQK
jgi:type IV secretory pathway component VirB8